MRTIALTTLLAAATTFASFAASTGAQAQTSYRHHSFCLLAGSARECAYDSFAQCEASKRGSADSCVQNSPPQDH